MRFHAALIVAFVSWCGVVAAAEPVDWRAPWNVTLTGRPVDAIPAELIIRIQNRGLFALVGTNTVFTLYRNDSLYGSAFDPAIRVERLWIPPGSAIERVSRRKDLKFWDLDGNEIPQAQVDKDLTDGKWRIVAALLDEETPKPKRESSYLIFSSDLSFGGTDHK